MTKLKQHVPALSVTERKALRRCEETIEAGQKTFVEIGNALIEIRDSHLYKETHKTFESYMKERWGFSRPRAYQLIEAAGVVTDLSTNGRQNGDSDYQVLSPINERQARILKDVPKEERAEVLQEAADRNDGKPTAAAIREVIAEREEEAEAEEELTFEQEVEEENKQIESFCRSLLKFFGDNCPELTWTKDSGRIGSAESNVKAACATLRTAKAVVCPACSEGQNKKGKCGYCKGHGYLPAHVEKTIPEAMRL